MPAPSLLQLARNSCVANIRHIYDVGDAPYHLVEPIIKKVENPKQLRAIEEASPQIAGADAEIWRNMIRRDIPASRRKDIEPKDPQNWWKVYRKLKKDADDEIQKQATTLKAALDQKEAEIKSKEMTIIRTPVDHRKRKPKPKPARSGAQPNPMRAPGSRSKVLTGSQFLEKMRKEAREAKTLGGKPRPVSFIAKQQTGPPPSTRPPAPVVGSATNRPSLSKNTPTTTASMKEAPKVQAKNMPATSIQAKVPEMGTAKDSMPGKPAPTAHTTGSGREAVPKQINVMQHPSAAGNKSFEKRFLSKRPGEPSIFMPKKKRKV